MDCKSTDNSVIIPFFILECKCVLQSALPPCRAGFELLLRRLLGDEGQGVQELGGSERIQIGGDRREGPAVVLANGFMWPRQSDAAQEGQLLFNFSLNFCDICL